MKSEKDLQTPRCAAPDANGAPAGVARRACMASAMIGAVSVLPGVPTSPQAVSLALC